MGTVYNPNMVTDGLAVGFDAANRRNYPGTGVVWNGTPRTTSADENNYAELGGGAAFNSGFGGYFSLDGTDDYILLPEGTGSGGASNNPLPGWGNITGEDVTNYSLELWFRTGDSSGHATNGYDSPALVGRNNGDVWANLNLWKGKAVFIHYNSSWQYTPTSITNISDNEWHHVVFVNHSDETGDIYIDGVAEATGVSTSLSDNSGTRYFRPDALGRGYNSKYLEGDFAMFKAYQKSLSAAEVLQNYQAMKPRFTPRVALGGLVAHLDAGNPHSYSGGATWNSLAVDFSRDGTLINSPPFSSANGGFFSFDGTDEYVLLPTPDNSTQPLTGWGSMTGLDTNNYSLEMWFRTDDAANPTGYCYNTSALMGRDNGADVVANWNIWQGELIFAHYNGTAWICSPTSTTDVSDDAWYHAVFVNHSNETGDIYINGVAEATGVSTSIGSGGGYTYYFHPDYIARGYNGQYFDGDVAVCRVYDKELSANEILQNYNAQKGRFA